MPALIGVGVYLGIAAAILYGYVMNIAEIVMRHDVINTLFILRCVGIVFGPLGVVLGYL
jgi:hypothetical protein